MENLETEKKEAGGHLPCAVAPKGQKGSHRLQVPRVQRPLLLGHHHLHRLCFHCTFCWVPLPSFCPCCLFPMGLSHIHFLLCVSVLTLTSASPLLTSPSPAFCSPSQCGGKAAQERPLPPPLEEKPGPRRQTLSLVSWKQVGWFFHLKSGTPKAVGHTSGWAEMSFRSLLCISIHSV